MTLHLIFDVNVKTLKKAIEFLDSISLHPVYHLQEKNKHSIGGFFENIPSDLPDFLKSYSILDTEIDWLNQWQEFSPHFKNDYFELDLTPYGFNKMLRLLPGPGFGDMSHATTRLCLKHMAHLCNGRTVVDFGCGSGVLSVVAWAFGAYKVISLDIDLASLEHTKKNLKLNEYSNEFVFEKAPSILDEDDSLCVINMTFGEQKIALADLSIFKRSMQFLSSGILSSQKKEYIDWAYIKGLEFELLEELEGWCIFKGIKL